jgi:hypothetical protein
MVLPVPAIVRILRAATRFGKSALFQCCNDPVAESLGRRATDPPTE